MCNIRIHTIVLELRFLKKEERKKKERKKDEQKDHVGYPTPLSENQEAWFTVMRRDEDFPEQPHPLMQLQHVADLHLA